MVQKSFMVSSYLAEQWQYLLLPKDNRFRSGGVFVFFAGVWFDSSSHFLFSCVVCIKAVDAFRALLYSPSLYRLCL